MGFRDVLDAYFAAWNENDEGERRARLTESLAEDGVYCDPTVKVVGPTALAHHIGQTRGAYGRFRIDRTSGYDEHHGYVRFTWRMFAEGGETIVEGFDVVRIGGDGRLEAVVGFFGPFPDR